MKQRPAKAYEPEEAESKVMLEETHTRADGHKVVESPVPSIVLPVNAETMRRVEEKRGGKVKVMAKRGLSVAARRGCGSIERTQPPVPRSEGERQQPKADGRRRRKKWQQTRSRGGGRPKERGSAARAASGDGQGRAGRNRRWVGKQQTMTGSATMLLARSEDEKAGNWKRKKGKKQNSRVF